MRSRGGVGERLSLGSLPFLRIIYVWITSASLHDHDMIHRTPSPGWLITLDRAPRSRWLWLQPRLASKRAIARRVREITILKYYFQVLTIVVLCQATTTNVQNVCFQKQSRFKVLYQVCFWLVSSHPGGAAHIVNINDVSAPRPPPLLIDEHRNC